MHSLAATRRCHRQHGAVIVTVVLVFLFLLGFIKITLDLVRVFNMNAELQAAIDNYSLATTKEIERTLYES